MSFEINRGDMKLLTEAGYSSIMRGLDVDTTHIFEALDTWMPDQAAGPIGTALQLMIAGQFEMADRKLVDVIEGNRQGSEEAKAILAMCKALQNDLQAVEKLAGDLEGQGGSAEEFTSLLTGKMPAAVE